MKWLGKSSLIFNGYLKNEPHTRFSMSAAPPPTFKLVYLFFLAHSFLRGRAHPFGREGESSVQSRASGVYSLDSSNFLSLFLQFLRLKLTLLTDSSIHQSKMTISAQQQLKNSAALANLTPTFLPNTAANVIAV